MQALVIDSIHKLILTPCKIAHTQQYTIIELPSQKPFEPANNAVTSLNVTAAQRHQEI